MKPFRIVVLVSEDRSDIYFANQMARRFPLAGIFVEQQYQRRTISWREKAMKAAHYLCRPGSLLARFSEGRIVSRYHEMARRAGDECFGEEGRRLIDIPESCRIVQVRGAKQINEEVYVRQIREMRPDLIVTCGCSILGKSILDIPDLGVLNLHGGLSQKYRGVWTTLWAIVNAEPEFVGATVHFVSAGIDDGDIVFQGRPRIEFDDNPETLYGKVVQLGVKLMSRAIEDVRDGRVVRYPLIKKGRLYLEESVTPEIFKRAIKMIEAGVIQSYLAEQDFRDARVESGMYGQCLID